MRSALVVVSLVVSGCGVKALDAHTYTLPHPSLAGSVPPHELKSSSYGAHASLTKVTNDEICIDTSFRSKSNRPEVALATVRKNIDSTQEEVGFCRGRSERSPEYCGTTEPFPSKHVFEPVIFAVEYSKFAANSYTKTGNRETVCVEEQVNRYGTVVGCARYIERDEEVEGWVPGLTYHARGGVRWCVPNKGLISPDGDGFDFALGIVPYRFSFTGGKSVGAPWGGTGGTTAETVAIDVAAAAEEAKARGVSREPADAPTPTTVPVASPPTSDTAQPVRPAASVSTPKPAARAETQAPTVDPLRERADPTFTIAKLEITSPGTASLSVHASGVVSMKGKPVGSWNKGAYQSSGGSPVLAVARNGEVWATGPKRLGRFVGDRLVLDNGATMELDARGHFRVSKGGKVEVSGATVKVRGKGTRLALLMGILNPGMLQFRKAP